MKQELNIDITGSEIAIETTLDALSGDDITVDRYYERGFAGTAGIFGAVLSISELLLPNLIEAMKHALPRDRDMIIKINGLEFAARDLAEASAILDLLSEKGLLANKTPQDEG